MDRVRKFQCKVCKMRFTQKKGLNSHLKFAHEIEEGAGNWQTHDCLFCKKRIRSMTDMEVHMFSHTKEKPYFCKQCRKEFSVKCNVNSHVQRLHNVNILKPFECEFCTMTFLNLSSLRSHIKTHLGEKPFKCKVCAKSFRNKADLQRHLQNHTGEKPFSCEICEKTFSRTSHITTHMRIHTGEKPYKCQPCGKTYGDQSSLKRHDKKMHPK